MKPWGKLAGGAAGLLTGRWYGVAAGVLIGHQFDRGLAEGQSIARMKPSARALLFRALGHIAKADGPVTQAEIRAARKLMASLGLSPEETRQAQADFSLGKQPGYPMFREATDYFDGFRSRLSERALLLRLLLATMLEAGEISRPTRAQLWEFAQALNFTRVEFAQLEALGRGQQGYQHSASGQKDAHAVAEAYALLGVTERSSNREIKRAYRKLMSRYHPDKQVGAKRSEAALTEAHEKSQAINQAYQLLQQRRGFR